MPRQRRALLAGLVALVAATPAAAQGTGPVPVNVGPDPTPICTDRPTKANVACTVRATPAAQLYVGASTRF